MTATTKGTLERAIVGGLWAILLVYIGWSAVKIQSNTTTLAVIEERVASMLNRMDRVEAIRIELAAVKAGGEEDVKAVWKEISSIKEHIASDTYWGKRIDERMDDLAKRIQKLEK